MPQNEQTVSTKVDRTRVAAATCQLCGRQSRANIRAGSAAVVMVQRCDHFAHAFRQDGKWFFQFFTADEWEAVAHERTTSALGPGAMHHDWERMLSTMKAVHGAAMALHAKRVKDGDESVWDRSADTLLLCIRALEGMGGDESGASACHVGSSSWAANF